MSDRQDHKQVQEKEEEEEEEEEGGEEEEEEEEEEEGGEREQQQQVLPRDFRTLKENKTESRCACGFIWGSRSVRPHLRPV